MNDLFDSTFLVICACLILVMQAGFLCIESGLTRSKNSINVAIKNLTDFGFSVLIFWFIGFGLMFGVTSHGWIGTTSFLPDIHTLDTKSAAFFIFQIMLCSTAVTIISGAVAERMRFFAYAITVLFVSSIVYPIFGHWSWNGLLAGQREGWLASRGFVDFAGSTTVHSVGGWVALAAVIVLGPRRGRFDREGRPATIPESNLPMTTLGVILLWFGWFGFNSGNMLEVSKVFPVIISNTILAGASGLVTGLIFGWVTQLKIRVHLVINGAVAGLVSISASCHVVESTSAVFIGSVAAAVMMILRFLLLRARIDDTVEAIPAHLAAGIWGTLAVAIFGDSEMLGVGLDRGPQLLTQLEGIVACAVWSFGLSYLFFLAVNKITPLRVGPEAEDLGLNISEHGARSDLYDLFQTMDHHANTGNLSLRAKEEPFTEIGRIAHHYNKVMISLEKAIEANKNLTLKRSELESKAADLRLSNQLLAGEIEMREKMALEKERQMVDAISSSRLASIGELAAGVAHEINNPLNGMVNYAQLVMDRVNGQERDFLGEIINEGKRIASIVKNLLDFSRQKEEPQAQVKVAEVLERSLQLLDSQLRRSGIHISLNIAEDVRTIRCRSRELQQVFINLISNAEHALNKRYPSAHRNKILEIEVNNLIAEGRVCIQFKDHGSGIEKEHLEQIFQPFFTTKESGKGTGLGLSICRKIVERYQGVLDIKSIHGQETQVSLVLPMS